MKEPELIEVEALSSGQILRNFAGYLPVLVFSALLYFLIVAGGLILLLKKPLGEDRARIVGCAIGAVVLLASGLIYVYVIVRQLSQSYLAIEDDTLIVRGLGYARVVEKHYSIDDIEFIVFGEQLNAAERVMDKLRRLGVPKLGTIGLAKDLKAGRLLITDKEGQRTHFNFINKVFDEDELYKFTVELHRRGVVVWPAPRGED